MDAHITWHDCNFAQDMFSTAVQDSKAWRAVILDETAVKVLSNVIRMSDLMSEHNIAVVENLNKNREPMRDIPGIYFVEPTAATVSRLAFDFGSRFAARLRKLFDQALQLLLTPSVKACSAMYSEAHVFLYFSAVASRTGRHSPSAGPDRAAKVPQVGTRIEPAPLITVRSMLCADSASTSNILVHALQVSLEYSVVGPQHIQHASGAVAAGAVC